MKLAKDQWIISCFEKAPAILLPAKWVVLLLFVFSTAFMFYGLMTRFSLDMALESWFQDDDPAKLALDAFRTQFGSDDGVYIVYRAKDDDVFSPQSLQTLHQLHAALDNARIQSRRSSELTRIERIDSLINIRYQTAQGDELISRKLVGLIPPTTVEASNQIRAIALSKEQFPLAYFSKDFQWGGIRLKTDFGTIPVDANLSQERALTDEISKASAFETEQYEVDLSVDESAEVSVIDYQDTEMDEYLTFMTDLRALLSRPEYQHFEFYYAGNAPMMEFAMHSMTKVTWLLGLMVIIVIGLLWLLFRSLSAVVWPMLVILASNIWTLGTAAWLGIELSNMVGFTFVLILAVGIADCVHVMSTYLYYQRQGLEHLQALTKSYRKTGMPILLTTITTMSGMFALSLSDIPQIGVFGVSSALGVLLAFIFTLFLLPVLLDFWHPSQKQQGHTENEESVLERRIHWLQPFLGSIPSFVARYTRSIILIYAAIFCLLIVATFFIKVDSNFAELTREGSEIRVTYEVVDEHMMGVNNMEIMMDFGQVDALKSAKTMRALDQLQQRLYQAYPQFVIKAFSMADLVKDTHRSFQEGRQEYYTIPNDDQLLAQLLYLFNSANAEDRRQLVSDDFSQTHLSVQIKNAGSYEYREFFDQVQQDIKTILGPLEQDYPAMEIQITGSMALMMVLVDQMSWAQIKSFSIAMLIISALMIVSLGSFQGGLIAMIPNLIPAIFTFGLMGLLGIPLDTDTLIIAPLIIGIAVDDTIHFMAHYKAAWMETGDVDAALSNTIREVGQAVTFTTLILGTGFFVLAFSDYLGIAKTGIFGSLAIFVALSSDLLLLPALIKWLKPNLGRRANTVMLAQQAS